MPTTAPASKRQFPLHVHISVMFTLLLIVLGVTLGIFNYLQTTRIILNSSQQLFQQIERDVQQDLQHTYQPIRHALRLLALNANTGIEGSESRMALLEPFVQTLKTTLLWLRCIWGTRKGISFWSAHCARKPRRTASLPRHQPPTKPGISNAQARTPPPCPGIFSTMTR